ncbi:MAG: GNAT family N-acetyltransferase [Idiomarina sp.]|nr:GNAT family N-acetyltransferase [Idiomarina sp.]
MKRAIVLDIRPSQRGKGLGILLLQLTLDRARAMGITPIHVHCHKANVASAQMILANHGRLASEIDDASGVIQRYLVD